MDLGEANRLAAWREHLAGLLAGRKVVAGVAPLAGMVEWVDVLEACGADRPLLLATSRGAGEVPGPDRAEVVYVETPRFASVTEELRALDRTVRSLPAHAAAAVAGYDPAGEALWMVGPFVDSTRPVQGRPVVGGRPPEWLAVEDKMTADALWEAVGAPHAPYAAVPVERAALARASADLDAGHGVVWAGDARDGFNGGGDFVRWVTGPEERAEALAFFAARCDRVRVMPFLEGVPCSIHGFVLPDGTAVFRPVELAILRGADRQFVYGGQGTSWDPDPADREEMRDLVRRTGEHLRATVGYRGAFGIDGIMTADGFRPTEVNSRMAAGIVTLGRVVDGVAFTLLQLNCAAGRDPGVGAAELEAWALPQMDARRVARAIAVSDRRTVQEATDIPVSWDGERLERSGPGSGLVIETGPSAVGTFARIRGEGVLAPGERVGPFNVALLRFLDDELGTGFGPVSAAPSVR